MQTRPYMRVIAPLDLSDFSYSPKDRAAPLVLHAPTARGVKGTEYVLAAVDRLRQEGLAFEFRLIERMPHNDLSRVLGDSDIVVDELYSDTVGVLSAEAMAAGNVVLTSYFADYAKTPDGCPAIDVNSETITDALRRAIVDRDLRARLTAAGRRYVEQHHECSAVASAILRALDASGIERHDFVPTFHQRFRISDEVLQAERADAARTRQLRWSKLRPWSR